jgi:hypothetical protein
MELYLFPSANDALKEESVNSYEGGVSFSWQSHNSFKVTVYTNDVDSLLFLDWIYNRPRPEDDASAGSIADAFNIPLYETTQAPTDLVLEFLAQSAGLMFISTFPHAACPCSSITS